MHLVSMCRPGLPRVSFNRENIFKSQYFVQMLLLWWREGDKCLTFPTFLLYKKNCLLFSCATVLGSGMHLATMKGLGKCWSGLRYAYSFITSTIVIV